MVAKTAFPLFYSGSFTTYAYRDGSLTMYSSRHNPELQFLGFKFPVFNGEHYVASAVSFEVTKDPYSGGHSVFSATPTGETLPLSNIDLATSYAKKIRGTLLKCTITAIVGDEITLLEENGSLCKLNISDFPDKRLLAKTVASSVVCVISGNYLRGIATEDGRFTAENFPG